MKHTGSGTQQGIIYSLQPAIKDVFSILYPASSGIISAAFNHTYAIDMLLKLPAFSHYIFTSSSKQKLKNTNNDNN